MIIPIFPQSENKTGKKLKPYLAYAISYPQSNLLSNNPQVIEDIFEPQKVMANSVHLENLNRVDYEYDDARAE